MVAPYRHVDSPEKLTDEELHEHYEMVRHSLEVLREVFKPGGFNVGMNLGRVAGAGIATISIPISCRGGRGIPTLCR